MMAYAKLPPPLYGKPKREQRLPAPLGQFHEAKRVFAARITQGIMERQELSLEDFDRVFTGAIMAVWSVGAEYVRDMLSPAPNKGGTP